jgi:hypothetical protein
VTQKAGWGSETPDPGAGEGSTQGSLAAFVKVLVTSLLWHFPSTSEHSSSISQRAPQVENQSSHCPWIPKCGEALRGSDGLLVVPSLGK